MREGIELLAPAGGMDQLKTALRFGANAVYGGMKQYGLRASASNFDDLGEAVAYAHAHGAKFYVTMNLLPFDRDLDGFVAAAKDACEAGVDAAIVSDLGAALTLHDEVPALTIHVSTQANVLNTPTAKHFCEATGATRVVLSREMSLEDIAAMRAKLPKEIELEAFVHGAMCVAYSGRCLLSRVISGRSANRGECSQPCRWGYHVMEEKRAGEYYPVVEGERGTFVFSAYDLCMLEHLPELLDAGVMSLKIEGRMKTSYYVATVVSAYRRALDALEVSREAYEELLPELVNDLGKASHRLSNTGFYFGEPQPAAGAGGFEQSMEFVGEIVEDAAAEECAAIRLKNRFYVGDRLEVLTPQGSKAFEVTALYAEDGEALQTASVAGMLLRMPFPFAVSQGDLLRGPNRNHKGK